MKTRTYLIAFLLAFGSLTFAQSDTISNNIYQYNGKFGIGTSFPDSRFTLIANEEVMFPQFGILSIRNNHYATFDGYSASNIHYVGSLLNGRRSRGTIDNPQDVITGDRISGIVSSMYYNNAFRFSSSILFYAGRGLNYGSYPSYIVFRTTDRYESESSERMRLAENGNLGIGTAEPAAKLHIADGDIYIENIERGIIMKSSGGQCWRGIMSDNGTLVFSPVDCPETQVVSTPTQEESGKLLVFPNPPTDKLNVVIKSEFQGRFYYTIQDISGRVRESSTTRSNEFVIDINHLPAGSYVLSVKSSNGNLISSEKFIRL